MSISSFREVIDLWDTREELAAEIGRDSRLVSKWWQRRSIPADSWASICDLPKARDAGVTAELLAELAAREPAEARA
jgi:hypothetical protein